MSDISRSEEDEPSVESEEWHSSSSSESEPGQEEANDTCKDIEIGVRGGANVLLNIHDQLDLAKLQQIKDIFFADQMTGAQPELDVKQFSDALRTVLCESEEMTDEDLEVLFMKIDANGSGDVDWDEFTGFLLQLDEGNRNMAAAAHMVDLSPLPGRAPTHRTGGSLAQHRGMIEKIINIERPGISAYASCGRDGTIRFWHKGTLSHLRSVSHLDTIKTTCTSLIMGAKSWEVEGGGRNVSSAPVRRAVKAMKSAWVCDIGQMPLINRIAAACLDRTISFYEMLTGEFLCRIAGLHAAPTCIDCVQVGPNEQHLLFGDSDGALHVWAFGKHFHIPGPHDTREATDLHGSFSIQMHTGAITCLEYVPDLNATVTCGMDGKVHFVDLVKRRVLRTFFGHADLPVFSFVYCQRHRFVASAGMGRGVVFWNPYTMHVLARGNGHASTVRHCLIDDQSGRVITVSADKIVRCWDSATFRCIQSFKDTRKHRPDDTVTAALWDESRSSLILGGNTLGAWKNKGAIQSTTRTHEAPVTAALYNRHFHQVVSADAMGNVHVWLVETGQVTFRFGGTHGGSKLSCMCFDASERRLLTGANDGTVKMWNFSNGKELQSLGSGSSSDGLVGEGSEVSGLAYCKDSRGTDKDGVECVATCAWDKQVRVFTMGNEGDKEIAQQKPTSGGGTHTRPPSRIFPGLHQKRLHHRGRSGGGTGGGRDGGGWTGEPALEGHSSDVLSIAHCGHQQVATGGFDGSIYVWATDSGKTKFSMKPADHAVSQVDEVSSIGGFTSVATLMRKERNGGLITDDGNSVDSGGHLLRMEKLLTEDTSTSRISWDGREYFAEERMGGSEDGSGTAVAANDIPADLDAAAVTTKEKESIEAAEPAMAGTTAPTATTALDVNAQHIQAEPTFEMGEKNTQVGTPQIAATTAVKTTNVTRNADDKQCSGNDVLSASHFVVAPTSVEGSVVAGNGTEAALAIESASRLDRQTRIMKQEQHHPRQDQGQREINGSHAIDRHVVVGGSAGNAEAVGAYAEKGLRTEDGPMRGAEGRGGGEGGEPEMNLERRRSEEKERVEDDGVVKLLENAASHTIDCLMYIRSHDVLVSGTASGELHFWDASTGQFIFAARTRHPNDAALSAMGSSEGTAQAYGSGAHGVGASDEGGGGGGQGGGGVAATFAATAASASAITAGNVNLMMYTACEEGYVKTWKVGDISEHAYEAGLRTRPKPDRKGGTARGGIKGQRIRGTAGGVGRRPRGGRTVTSDAAPPKTPSGTTETTGSSDGYRDVAGAQQEQHVLPAAATPSPHYGRSIARKVLLQPVQQWQAHESTITSVEGASFRGKLDLLVTAGADCFVHLWTIAGAHIGTFGQQSGMWHVGSRLTWRDPTGRAIMGTRDRLNDDTDDPSTATTGTTDQESRTTRKENRRLRRQMSKNSSAISSGGGGDVEETGSTAVDGGNRAHRKTRRRDFEKQGKKKEAAEELDLIAEKEQTDRYQEKRYYAASQNRVERKLLRGRLSAFCMSRDYFKKEQLQEVSNILSETAKKNCLYPTSAFARPGLSKQRMASILRNTYNQVSFQLQLHKHDDVHDKAETVLTRRKSRRRAKSAINHGHQHHYPPQQHGATTIASVAEAAAAANRASCTPPTLPSTPAGTAPPPADVGEARTAKSFSSFPDGSLPLPIHSFGGGGGVESGDGSAKAIDSVSIRGGPGRGRDTNRCGFGGRGAGGRDSGSHGAYLPSVEVSPQHPVKACPVLERDSGHGSVVRPAAPTHPPSTCATNSRQFRPPM